MRTCLAGALVTLISVAVAGVVVGAEKGRKSMTEKIVYDVDKILASTNSSDAAYALVTAIRETRKDTELKPKEQDIYYPYEVHWRIMMDGIDGTLFNIGLGPFVWAGPSLEKLGAKDEAKMIRRVVESFGQTNDVQGLIEKFRPKMITPEQKKLFDELDSQYYDLKHDFYGLIVEYVKKNIEEFRAYQKQR